MFIIECPVCKMKFLTWTDYFGHTSFHKEEIKEPIIHGKEPDWKYYGTLLSKTRKVKEGDR